MNKEHLNAAMTGLTAKRAEDERRNVLNTETNRINSELLLQLSEFLSGYIAPEQRDYQSELLINLGRSKIAGLGRGKILMNAQAYKKENGSVSEGYGLSHGKSTYYSYIDGRGANFHSAEAVTLSFGFLPDNSEHGYWRESERIAEEHYGEGSNLKFVSWIRPMYGAYFNAYNAVPFESADHANQAARLRQQQLPETMVLIAAAAADPKLNPELAGFTLSV